MIRLAPNQKAVRIHKRDTKNVRFVSFTYESMLYAMQHLSTNALKVWLWLCGNKDGYDLALSGVVLQADCGFSSATYSNSVKELITKGFLTKAELKRNLEGYIFWEGGAAQQEEEQIPLSEEDKQRVTDALNTISFIE